MAENRAGISRKNKEETHSRLWPLFCLILFVVAGVFAYLWWTTQQRLARLQSEVTEAQDAGLERAAMELMAKRERVSVRRIRSLNRAVTVRLPDQKCVELRPSYGVLGGSQTFCFSTRTGQLLSEHAEAE